MTADHDGRLHREREFHDARYDAETRGAARRFYDVDASERAYRDLLADVGAASTVVEYGCGTGSAAFDLAAAGADVLGIDISPVAIRRAEVEAERRGLSIRFLEMDAEALRLPDSSVDVVCGSGILHHLDLDRATAEIHRVLRPGGRAVFKEPLGTNPLINVYRRLTPRMRTPDEHPLLDADLEGLRDRFASVELCWYNLLSLAAVPLRGLPGGVRVVSALHAADRWLFARVPPLRRWAWIVVIRLGT